MRIPIASLLKVTCDPSTTSVHYSLSTDIEITMNLIYSNIIGLGLLTCYSVLLFHVVLLMGLD